MEKRKKKYCNGKCTTNIYKYSGKLICGICGKHYQRKTNNAGTKYEKVVWICDTYNKKGKAFCESKQIPENILDNLIDGINFDTITVYPDNRICIKLSDNEEIEKEWGYK